MNIVQWWRVINALLAFLAFLFLVLDLVDRASGLSKRRLYLTFSLAGLLLAITIGNVQAAIGNFPLTFSAPIVSASCLWCIFGLWVSRHDET